MLVVLIYWTETYILKRKTQTFRQNNAILREQLCSFLSHFNFYMVGDMSFFKGLYCSVGLYIKQGMYNCSVYQLLNYSLRSCRELAICTAMAAKGDGSENILHNGKKHCCRWF
jgi:hypothetical protein